MPKTPTLLSLFYLAISIILVLNRVIPVNSESLEIRLIHPDSPESPFYQSNLSREERTKRLVSQSNLRANHLAATTFSSSYMGTQIDVQDFHYIVKIGIGTFNSKPPFKEYFLDMDTGSSQVWLQCEGCTKCFDQTPKPFPNQNSISFRPVLDRNVPKPYFVKYADGSSTYGVVGRETFYLKSKSGTVSRIPNVRFGCGLQNDMMFWKTNGSNKIAGTMGLGWNKDTSFVEQTGPKTNGKFSYCLPLSSGKTSNTYLKFGDDPISLFKSTKKTPLYKVNGIGAYFVDLQGISINKTRLKSINPNVFASFNNSSGPGCVIDTGTPLSRIKTPAFEILKHEMEKHLSRMQGMRKIRGGWSGMELCYERGKEVRGFDNLPDVTFHLRGGAKADFVMKAEAVFVFSGNRFCLAMVRDDRMSIIGSHQQTNQRITYDIKKKVLVFYRQDCAKNS